MSNYLPFFLIIVRFIVVYLCIVFSLSIKLPIKMTEIKANLQAVSVVSMGVPGVISQWASYVRKHEQPAFIVD